MIKRRGTSGVLVTFELPASVAASASVCGEFNDWSPRAHPMVRTSSGQLEVVIELEAGRAWRFRYLLDDERWENDWAADAYAPNEFGAEDSVVDLVGVESQPSEPAGTPPHSEAPAEAHRPSVEATAETKTVKKAKKPSTEAAGTNKAATKTTVAKKAATKTTAAAAEKTAAKKSATSGAAKNEPTNKSDVPIEKSAAKKAVPRKSAVKKADTRRVG